MANQTLKFTLSTILSFSFYISHFKNLTPVVFALLINEMGSIVHIKYFMV